LNRQEGQNYLTAKAAKHAKKIKHKSRIE